MAAGNSFNRGPPRMERGRGGVGGGYRGNRGGSFNPMNPAQPMGFTAYEAKGVQAWFIIFFVYKIVGRFSDNKTVSIPAWFIVNIWSFIAVLDKQL